jgi:hypothetical protein
MVTSRLILEIEEEFHDVTKVEIRATTEDVEQFVADRMSRLPKCVRRNDNELKAFIQDKVVEAADGMLVRRFSDTSKVSQLQGFYSLVSMSILFKT